MSILKFPYIYIYIFNKNEISRNVSVMNNEIIIKETFAISAYIRKAHIVDYVVNLFLSNEGR